MQERIRTSVKTVRVLSISIALSTIFSSSILTAQAAYQYSPDTTMPEAGIRIALMDATTRGVVTPKLSDDLDIFKDTLKTCRKRVSSLIAAGEATGGLTVSQTDTLRFELDGLNGLDKEISKTEKPNYQHMLQLADHYDTLQARINQLMSDYELDMVPTDPAAVLIAGNTVNLDLAMKRRAVLEDDISAELAKGQITGGDGAELRDMLNVTAVKEGALRKSGGGLRATQRTQVDSGLDKVSTALNLSLNM